ncbi:MAG: sialate O-acetylesterase [Saprospiraceae bacterium]|nr:sialate O-acetylesterase [Saprospiraceae bacterium]
MKCILVILYSFFMISCKKSSDLVNSKPLWIFVLAGQSNMAGRGAVENEDTITHPDILILDSLDHWAIAKEPLHYYEPMRRGLDCGMAFARELLRLNQDSIRIGLVPCAVGGSSVEQWLYDSTHRDVQLFSNFIQKLDLAKSKGPIKGILWHQGESNLNSGSMEDYSLKLDSLFLRMSAAADESDMPVIMGELGQFLKASEYRGKQVQFNALLHSKDSLSPGLLLVSTRGLTHKGDRVHFDSPSLRELGKRYARAFMDY